MSKSLAISEVDIPTFVDYLAKGLKPCEAILLSGYAGKDPNKDSRALLERKDTQERLNRIHQGAKFRLKGMTLEKMAELYELEWPRMNTRQKVAFALGMADRTGITEVPNGTNVNINVGQVDRPLTDQIKELAEFLRKENLVGQSGTTVIDVTPESPGEMGSPAATQAEE